MKKMVPVLMFHALYRNKADLYDADTHYAKSVSEFSNWMDYLYAKNIAVDSIRNFIKEDGCHKKNICFTFDDGHISNYEIALSVLLKHRSSADFFINSAFVGNKGYIDWSGLRDMEMSGMSIQSHGHHHHYFDDLDSPSIKNELELSKKLIEDKIGSEVSIFSPPGGRITSSVKRIALDLGYSAVTTSRPGYWVVGESLTDIPRLAVLNKTSLEQMQQWADLGMSDLYKIVAKYYLMKTGKKLLGNSVYEKLRSVILGN